MRNTFFRDANPEMEKIPGKSRLLGKGKVTEESKDHKNMKESSF